MENPKFAASFSSGKDSALAVYKAIKSGMQPAALLMTYDPKRSASWFHGVPQEVLQQYESAAGISLRLIQTEGGDAYEQNFEKELAVQKQNGVEVCVFGDIDLEQHREWCCERCAAVGMVAHFPLWQMDREAAVREFIAEGFTAHITVVNTEKTGNITPLFPTGRCFKNPWFFISASRADMDAMEYFQWKHNRPVRGFGPGGKAVLFISCWIDLNKPRTGRVRYLHTAHQ